MKTIKPTTRQKVLPLFLTGVVPLMQVITLEMRGTSVSTTAGRATAIRPLTVMFGVLGQDSNLTFDFESWRCEW